MSQLSWDCWSRYPIKLYQVSLIIKENLHFSPKTIIRRHLSPSVRDSPSPDGGTVSVPHTPEGAQERNLLGPSSALPPGPDVLYNSRVVKTLFLMLLLKKDREMRHTATPLDWQRVHWLTRVHLTCVVSSLNYLQSQSLSHCEHQHWLVGLHCLSTE